MRNVEILAPAGSYESLCGAINGGCDAVYLGGSQFGARAFAENFDEDTMLRSIDYVHFFDKKIYLTVNTLLHNEEMEEQLFAYLEKYYMQGLDAVIVQDVGVLAFIQRNFPRLPIHASTQMTFTTEQGGELLKEYGVTRFVTSRELSIQEIAQICGHTELEVETFVHGALCYCYSGQCLLSSMIGGRSGNRGRCAQPCRMQYQVKDEKGHSVVTPPYVLSPKDMCTLDKIPDLVDAGIHSFKIEGRMKKPEYAAFTAYLYRKYTDLYLEYGSKYKSYLERNKKELEYDYTCLMDLYNRGGFSSGYFYKKNGPVLMSMVRPNHSGVEVGVVERMRKNRAVIRLSEDIFAQDVLEFRRKDGTVLYEYTVKEDTSLQTGIAETNTKPGTRITPGTKVYRTRRNALLTTIQKNILQNQKRIPVSFFAEIKVGEPFVLTCNAKGISVTVYGSLVEAAKSQPMTKEKIEKQFRKLNETIFTMEDCEIFMSEEVFVPVGQLNALRRKGLEQVLTELAAPYRREQPMNQPLGLENESVDEERKLKLTVSVNTEEQAKIANRVEQVTAIALDLGSMAETAMINIAAQSVKEVLLILPAVIRRDTYAYLEEAMRHVYMEKVYKTPLEQLFSMKQVKGFVIKSYEGIALYKKYVEPNSMQYARLDYNMYTFNREAKAFWKRLGITRSTASLELNGTQWRHNGCSGQEIVVYGRTVVMTSAQCVCKNTIECVGEQRTLYLKDKFEKMYSCLNRCKYCYNQIYETVPVSLHEYAEEILSMKAQSVRVEFLQETKQEAEEILLFFVNTFIERKHSECPIKEYSIGHFRKGVK